MKKPEQKSTYGNTWESEVSDDGEFIRHQTSFREQVRVDGSTEFKPEAGRYHLYVSYACPWAHRTLITRKLKGLENIISFDVVNPLLPRTGWSFETSFPGSTGDRVNGFPILRDVYLTSNSQFNCAVTVPVLWDRESSRIVDYPNIWGFTRDVYQLPGVAETVNMASR